MNEFDHEHLEVVAMLVRTHDQNLGEDGGQAQGQGQGQGEGPTLIAKR
jgi:hypothetical protein